MPLPPGALVTDRSDEYDDLYRVIRVEGARTLVRYIGLRIGDRMQFASNVTPQTAYRCTENLVKDRGVRTSARHKD